MPEEDTHGLVDVDRHAVPPKKALRVQQQQLEQEQHAAGTRPPFVQQQLLTLRPPHAEPVGDPRLSRPT